MKYLKLYKLFESYLSADIVATLSNEIEEEIEDINLELSEENPSGDPITGMRIRNHYNKNLKLRIDSSLKKSIVDELLIDYDYMPQLITIYGTRTIYNSIIKRIKRMCAYLSIKHNVDLDVVYMIDTYIISSKKLISIINWIFLFEFRYIKSTFNTFDESSLEDYDSLAPLKNKWDMLCDMDFLFRSMATSYKSTWSTDHSTIINQSSFNGFFVHTTDIDKNRILVFKFDRGDNIGETMKYSVDIYFDRMAPRHKNTPLPQLISKCESNFPRVERFNIEFDVYDKEDTTMKFFKILIDKTIQFFKIEKLNLLNRISNLLSETNEFFRSVEIDVYLESREDPQLGIVQFVIYDIELDDDKIFTVYVDDNLNIYINSIKEEDRTSLEELIHDVYLKLTEK